MSRVSAVYLAAYNGIQLIGWGFALYLIAFPQTLEAKYTCEQVLQVFQTLALMEVVHSCLGIVKSAPMTTAIQIASRLFLLWGVLHMYPEVKAHENFNKIMFISWCLADATRYLYYFTNTFMESPLFLTFLRYNLFLILYPTGILGEVALLGYSLIYAGRKPWINYSLPNALNFGFNTFELYCIVLLVYIPCSPLMYSHMMAQRRKVMGQKKKTA